MQKKIWICQLPQYPSEGFPRLAYLGPGAGWDGGRENFQDSRRSGVPIRAQGPKLLGGKIEKTPGPGPWALGLCPGSWALGLGPGPVPRVLGPGPGPCVPRVLGPGLGPVSRVLGPGPGPWSCAQGPGPWPRGQNLKNAKWQNQLPKKKCNLGPSGWRGSIRLVKAL